jgi:hypothetical membrane protein
MREKQAVVLCGSVLIIGCAMFLGLGYVAKVFPETTLHHTITATWVVFTFPLTASVIALTTLAARRLKRKLTQTN